MNTLLSSVWMIKLIRFGLVGATGVFIDFAVTYLCKEKLNLNRYMASTIGFCLAASSNYYLNRIWTFANTDPDIVAQYTKFLIVATIGVLISNGIVWLVHEKKSINFYVAKAASIIVVMAWNFSINALITFQ